MEKSSFTLESILNLLKKIKIQIKRIRAFPYLILFWESWIEIWSSSEKKEQKEIKKAIMHTCWEQQDAVPHQLLPPHRIGQVTQVSPLMVFHQPHRKRLILEASLWPELYLCQPERPDETAFVSST